MNADEMREKPAKCGIGILRKIVATDIASLKNG